ncbi:RNA pseudouridine synthase [Altererythrobacter xixiisoli]|uniref:RNA pseudouridine synthase n=1 Tax=Croceibacterium xixiisoli TaxID=1476466 RepID=A0A6I4TQN2_9SPHN|nr:RNA pseudouridine synthase [Croceibacterium xixiisoli]MXO97659.1 RNA pseudouridine synthase [Croceibacterium xixiisoli]
MIPILFEDAEALVINKPGGLPVEQPRAGGPSLDAQFPSLRLGFQREPVAVHRLDTDTSGCLLLARNPKALTRFSRAFEERQVSKLYYGVLAGVPEQTEGTVALSLSKISSAEAGWRMIPAKKGKPAVTHWQLIEVQAGLALVAFRPETGRTHQIRVHAASGIGIPLLGDPVYGAGPKGPDGARIKRTMLHAAGLRIEREGKEPVIAHAILPADMRALGFAEPAGGFAEPDVADQAADSED